MAAHPLSSMTGFAREGGTLADGSSFLWELRSVNGRGLDVRLRLPNGFDAIETPLKEATARLLKRGNVSATLTVKREERAAPRLTPDPAALDQALRIALDLAARIPGAAPPRAEALLTLPGVLRSEIVEPDEAEEEAKRTTIATAYAKALDGLIASRRAEGEKLTAILGVL
ncbi:MAG TPA: YicC/YloC family endoribonuclease, partial [Roseomonas sp.]|nr:YicC/YloC family endoribonuclease [Roseomonas sp.]